ncbi:hypothetical protein CLF_101359 [Clonorchis sinensis]|uniref:Uncharacterized protein n=1 Tax=Clonorchis sinensis TaxID=79923 RepID=G7Y5K5_CLOSI|nr:hypothetical protein CLF_101359 [Clonorchis sinensis]
MAPKCIQACYHRNVDGTELQVFTKIWPVQFRKIQSHPNGFRFNTAVVSSMGSALRQFTLFAEKQNMISVIVCLQSDRGQYELDTEKTMPSSGHSWAVKTCGVRYTQYSEYIDRLINIQGHVDESLVDTALSRQGDLSTGSVTKADLVLDFHLMVPECSHHCPIVNYSAYTTSNLSKYLSGLVKTCYQLVVRNLRHTRFTVDSNTPAVANGVRLPWNHEEEPPTARFRLHMTRLYASVFNRSADSQIDRFSGLAKRIRLSGDYPYLGFTVLRKGIKKIVVHNIIPLN